MYDDIQQSIEEDEDIRDSSFRQDQDDIHQTEFPNSAAKRRRLNTSPIEDPQNDVSSVLPRGNDDDLVEDPEDLEDPNGLNSSLTEISSPSAPTPYPQTQSRPRPRFLPPSTPQSRFKPTIGTPSTPASSNTHTFSKPPRFRPPSPNSQPNANREPLPDAFSPRKRDEKYVVGGLASELRSWILNVGNERSSTSRNGFAGPTIPPHATSLVSGHAQNSKTSPWKFKILIDEISGGQGAGEAGMTLVRGRQIIPQSHEAGGTSTQSEMVDSLGQIKIILAGAGIVDGLNRAKKVGVGMTVGIKGPTWDTVVEGVTWGVVCEWRIF